MFYWRQFCAGKKRGPGVGKTKRGKGSKLMAVADGAGLPIAVCVTSANPHEVKLVEQTLEKRFIEEVPDLLIGDKAYDSDPSINDLLKKELKWLRLIARIVKRRRLRMAENCGAIGVDGKLNDFLRGCKTLEGWWFDTNINLTITWLWLNWRVAWFYSKGIFEMTSNQFNVSIRIALFLLVGCFLLSGSYLGAKGRILPDKLQRRRADWFLRT